MVSLFLTNLRNVERWNPLEFPYDLLIELILQSPMDYIRIFNQALNFGRMGCVCGRENVTLLKDSYTIMHRLSEGGFSVIDIVRRKNVHRSYAMKTLVCHSSRDKRLALQEIEYLKKFSHENIIKLEDYGVIESKLSNAICVVHMILPLYSRGSVFDELTILTATKDFLVEPRLIMLFQGVCNAVHAIHSEGLAHRDIKPHNILLSNDDVPVLMDFGSMGKASKAITNMSEAQQLQDFAAEFCTMPYRAPELFNIDTDIVIDERVDIWSLGCTLYAFCFHKSPFDDVFNRGDSVALATMSGHVHIPEVHTYSTQLIDLIILMLTVDHSLRPFIHQVMCCLDTVKATIHCENV